jgi:holo-[acyl-carrier protein] synthase
MYSIGADIVEVSRIEPWVEEEAMLERVFTSDEKERCLKKKRPQECLAAFFAVKEAFMKAAGTGWDSGLDWLDIEVCTEGRGAVLRLRNRAGELFSNKKVSISFSSGRGFAAAFVVVEEG